MPKNLKHLLLTVGFLLGSAAARLYADCNLATCGQYYSCYPANGSCDWTCVSFNCLDTAGCGGAVNYQCNIFGCSFAGCSN